MRRTIVIRLLLPLLVVVCLSGRVEAQRLLPMQHALEFTGGLLPRSDGASFIRAGDYVVQGAFVQYLRVGNYLGFNAVYEQRGYEYKEWHLPVRDFLFEVTYNHPLLFNRGRDIFLYAGAGAVGGYELVAVPEKATLRDTSRWLYGGMVQATIEGYLGDRIVLILRGQGRFLFGKGSSYVISPAVQLGLRFNV